MNRVIYKLQSTETKTTEAVGPWRFLCALIITSTVFKLKIREPMMNHIISPTTFNKFAA